MFYVSLDINECSIHVDQPNEHVCPKYFGKRAVSLRKCPSGRFDDDGESGCLGRGLALSPEKININ